MICINVRMILNRPAILCHFCLVALIAYVYFNYVTHITEDVTLSHEDVTQSHVW